MCVCVCVRLCAFGHPYLNNRCLDFLNGSVPIGWNKRIKNLHQANKQTKRNIYAVSYTAM